jgi:hypothetical protein
MARGPWERMKPEPVAQPAQPRRQTLCEAVGYYATGLRGQRTTELRRRLDMAAPWSPWERLDTGTVFRPGDVIDWLVEYRFRP